MDAQLTTKFLEEQDLACNPTANALSTCFIGDIYLKNCEATITCQNIANSYVLECDREKTYSLMARLTNEILATDKENADKVLETIAKAGVDTSKGVQQSVEAYLSVKCDPYVVSQQSVYLPKIVLSDCNDVNITAVNTLDQVAKCSLGKMSEVFQVAGVGSRNIPPTVAPQPSAVVYIVIGVVAVVLLVLAIVLGVVLRKKRIQNFKNERAKFA